MSISDHSPQPLQKVIDRESKAFNYIPLFQAIERDYDFSQKFMIMYGIAAAFYDISKKENIKINVSPKYIFLDQNLHPFIDQEKLKSDSETQDLNNFAFNNAKYKEFLPMEVIQKGSPSENHEEKIKGDSFIFGSICFALSTNNVSFKIEDEINDFPVDVPLSLFDLIKSCWETDLTKRPTFADILQIMNRQDFIDEMDNIDVDAFKEYQKKVVDKQFIQDLKLNFVFDLTKIPKVQIREREDFIFKSPIGRGGFGIVREALDKTNDNKKVAAKEISFEGDENEQQSQIRIYREVEILACTNNYAVQKLYGIINATEDKPIIILTPLEERGGLDKIIKIHPKGFDFTQKYIVMYGIAAGMHYLHNKSIIHRDIKPENVLMNKNLEPIITDFGLSKQVADNNNLFQSMAQTGSILYMAPELLDGGQSSEYSLYNGRLSDVYAYGNVVYNLFTGKIPYYDVKGKSTIIKAICDGKLPKLPPDFPHVLELLIKACCAKFPENRPSFEEILKIIGNPAFIEHAGEKVDMKRFEEYQKKVIIDNSFIIRNNEDYLVDDSNSDNLPEIPKEKIRSRGDFEVISKPEEDTDPFFITAVVNDTHSGGQYSYYQLKREYFNDDDLHNHLMTMLQVMFNSDHITINHPYAFIPGSPQIIFKENADSLFDIFPRATRGPPIILFPFMKNGNLQSYKEELSITQKVNILYGIAAGMYYLHDNQFAHLNLNPENILLNDQLEPIISLDITSRPYSCKENLFYLLPAFSYSYVAPELLDFKDGKTNSEINEEMSDVYSFAMIAYFLFTGFEPWDSFKSYQSILTKTKNNERPLVENLVPYPFNKLIQDCWYTNPLKRPSFKAILSRIGSSNFIRSIEDLDVQKFQQYQKTVVDDEFIYPIQLYSIRNYEDFEFGKLIGTGMFGNVRLTVDKTNNNQLASKEIPPNETENDKLHLDREIKILSSMNFQSIVSLYGIILPEGKRKETIILFPYAPNGDLEKIITKENNNQKPREFNYTKRCIIMYGVAMGMYKLHENNIIHRDLKPQNILINQFFEPWITDFGLSKYIDQNQTMYQSMTVGTPSYMAPEVFNDEMKPSKGNMYDGKRADVYSYGILVYYLMTGMQPWPSSKNQFALINKITKGERPTIPPTISEKMKSLIESCWQQNPAQRPTFKDILEDISDPNFFKGTKGTFNEFEFYKYQIKLGELDFIKFSDEQIENFQKMSDRPKSSQGNFNQSIRLTPAQVVRNLAEEGNPNFQYRYACMLRDGKGIPKDLEEAAVYFKKATENGNIDAQVDYALCLKDGIGIEKDDAEANRLMSDAADKDNTDAQVLLAGWYIRERPRKYGLAYDILKKAEAKMQPNAPAMIGSLMEKRKLGTIPSKEEIMKYYKESCDMASPEGMYHMATFYHYGVGVECNTNEAVRLYNLAANSDINTNRGAAVYSLSVLYEEIGQNDKAFEIADYYRNQDMFEGYARCADLYSRGIGVTKDVKMSKECLKIAKDPKFVKEQMITGLLYSRGKGVIRDKSKAFYWTDISAKNGSPAGQANLASYYLDGYGCEQNIDKAEEWGLKSAEQGNDHALMILARVYRKKELPDQELDCLEKAVKLGNERALVELGKKYKELKRNDEAIKCFKEAAECRIPMGMLFYGKELIKGRHTDMNLDEGIQMIETAAEMGCRDALKKIINIYTNGEKDIKPNAEKAKKFSDIFDKLPARPQREHRLLTDSLKLDTSGKST